MVTTIERNTKWGSGGRFHGDLVGLEARVLQSLRYQIQTFLNLPLLTTGHAQIVDIDVMGTSARRLGDAVLGEPKDSGRGTVSHQQATLAH